MGWRTASWRTIAPLYLILVTNIQDEAEEICGLRQLVRSSSAIDGTHRIDCESF
jgi:hypothetical protein